MLKKVDDLGGVVFAFLILFFCKFVVLCFAENEQKKKE